MPKDGLSPDENGSYVLPEEGTRLDSSFVIHLNARENWVGFWLPGSENWSDALGICKDAFTQIKAETWTMTKVGSSWWGPSNATFDYGKGYIMYVDENQYPDGLDFYWNITFHAGGRFVKSQPETFTYQEKADYEVIDIQSIEDGENIDEIGVFVNGI
ncbi:MAG: hypothetical protein J7K29_04130, partial [Candidatus Cloacimonetes bacterium]|nr:hypothetical protein [Candidatus Cloacimonadota bacterium]